MAKRKGPKTANGVFRKAMTKDGRKNPEKAYFGEMYEQVCGKKKRKAR